MRKTGSFEAPKTGRLAGFTWLKKYLQFLTVLSLNRVGQQSKWSRNARLSTPITTYT